MVRFSCFQARIHTHKQKKIIQLPAEEMHKTLEDTSQNWVQKNLCYSEIENKQCLGEVVQTLNNGADYAINSSPSERDCRSEEIESKYNSDYNIEARKKAQIKKSQSLGSGLNLKERTSGGDHSEGEMEQRFSYDGSADGREMVIPDGINDHALSPSEQCQEPMASESVVNSDLARNISIFSLGDSQHSEKEVAGKDDLYLFGAGDTGDQTPRTPRIIVKSRSLPRIVSPSRHSTSFLPCSRSSEDLNALYFGKKNMLRCDLGRQVQNLEREYSFFNFEKGNDENPDDGTCEIYNYVGSAKDWIIPISDGANFDKSKNEETAFHRWDEVPSKDLRLKRIEEWVIDLQHCSPLEEGNNESALCIDHELLKSDALLEDHSAAKLEVKVNPGMEAAKRYISSLNASATAAQLTNLGLVVIPFLSPFVSLKALNLSGNSIVRISAGALPRGLHILNLSKNSISTIEGLRELTRLRVLDLSYNRILRIGHGLASCSSLKELYLAGNKISEVEGLHRLLKLNILDLRFNKISTTKCLGQLAANYNCLQVLSLEGNPAQKNVGDEQLKKYVQSLLPHLTYYNRQSIKVGTTKDITADRSARLGNGGHQVDRGLRADLKTVRKATHGIIAQKASSSSIHGRKNHTVVSQKPSRSRQGRLPPSGMRTTQGLQFPDFSSKLLSLKNDLSIRRSRSEGTLGAP